PRTNFYSCSAEDAAQPEFACCGEYQLESPQTGFMARDGSGGEKPSPANMYVLLRLDHGAVVKVRPANAGCRLNAGGIPFTWLTDVQPDDSVDFLAKLAPRPEDSQNNGRTEDFLAPLAMHAIPAATSALTSL